MRKCPYCCGEIPDEAAKCMHCEKSLEPEGRAKGQEGNERLIAMWCHLGTLAGFLIPFGNIIVPLVLWVSKKDEMPLVDDQGKEALNFQISLFLYGVVAFLLVFLVVGIFLMAVIALFALIQVILAGMSASRGERYRYPLCLRIIT